MREKYGNSSHLHAVTSALSSGLPALSRLPKMGRISTGSLRKDGLQFRHSPSAKVLDVYLAVDQRWVSFQCYRLPGPCPEDTAAAGSLILGRWWWGGACAASLLSQSGWEASF